jgi:hypothetical protein
MIKSKFVPGLKKNMSKVCLAKFLGYEYGSG